MRLLPLPPPAQGRLLSIQSEDPLPGHHPTSLSQIPQKLAQTGDQPGMREEKVIPGPGLHLCPRARALTPTIPKVEIAGTSFPTPIPPLKEKKKKKSLVSPRPDPGYLQRPAAFCSRQDLP